MYIYIYDIMFVDIYIYIYVCIHILIHIHTAPLYMFVYWSGSGSCPFLSLNWMKGQCIGKPHYFSEWLVAQTTGNNARVGLLAARLGGTGSTISTRALMARKKKQKCRC